MSMHPKELYWTVSTPLYKPVHLWINSGGDLFAFNYTDKLAATLLASFLTLPLHSCLFKGR